MTDNHHWMYRQQGPREDCNDEFFNGLEQSFDFVYNRLSANSNAKIRYPCSKYRNLPHHNKVTKREHLVDNGFMDAYFVWWAHGETLGSNADPWSIIHDVASSSNIEEHVDDEDDFHHLVYDAFYLSKNYHPMTETEFQAETIRDEPSRHAQPFYDLLHASTIWLGPSSNNQTVLGWLAYMLHTKSKNNITGVGFNEIIHGYNQLLSLEDQQKVLANFYEAKKFMKSLSLGYVKIDAYVNNYFLYYREEAKLLTAYPVCGECRYKICNSTQT
ncbi:hypothetical protein SLA2020_232980 [Shorea laevis]